MPTNQPSSPKNAVSRPASRGSVKGAPDSVAASVYDTTRGVLETLCRELSLCLRYYSVTFRGQRPSLVRVVGGGANDPTIVQILAAGLSIPVERGLPLASLHHAERIHVLGGHVFAFRQPVGLGAQLGLLRAQFGLGLVQLHALVGAGSLHFVQTGHVVTPGAGPRAAG